MSNLILQILMINHSFFAFIFDVVIFKADYEAAAVSLDEFSNFDSIYFLFFIVLWLG